MVKTGCLLAFLSTAEGGWVSEHGQLSLGGKYGTQIVDKNGNPVQLRGMSTFSPPWMAECIQQDAIKYMKDTLGANLVRVAMDAGTRYNDAVNWAIDNDMYVLVDYHYIGAKPLADDNAKNFFKYAAQTWGNKPNIIYELFNEPEDASWSSMKPYFQTMIDVIRPIDSKNLIVAGTPAWSGKTGDVVGNTLNDKLTLYTKHFYASSHYDSQDIGNLLTQIPVFVTEWGVCDYTGGGNIDFGNAQKWQDMMNGGNPAGVWVSWANWGWDDKAEACAFLNGGSCNAHNWGSWTSSGQHVAQYMKAAGPPSGPPAPPTPTPPTPAGQCTKNPGQNNNGVNLESASRSASSPDQCCSLCAAAPGCVGYTHVTANNECWLKSSLGALTSDSYVNSGSYSAPAPTPVPSPRPTPTPTPKPTPQPSPAQGCPGGSLKACIGMCPMDSPVAFQVCVDVCTEDCSTPSCGDDDGSSLSHCVQHCPAASFADCIDCCKSKFPSTAENLKNHTLVV